MKTKLVVAIVALGCLLPLGAHAVIPDAVPNLPILGVETKTGSLIKTVVDPVAPTPKTVDGNIHDWTGQSTHLGGTTIYSHGELIYQDFIGDAWGADDGSNASRMQTLDTLKSVEPRTYRTDSLQQAAGAQFGAPAPIGATLSYGETSASDALRNQADIEEVRMAADDTNLYFLVRTTGMLPTQDAAALILIDTNPDCRCGTRLSPSFGGITTEASRAFLVSRDGVQLAGAVLGCMNTCPPSSFPWSSAVNSSGYDNAIEFSVRRDFLGAISDHIKIGVATGIYDSTTQGLHDYRRGDAKSTLINVAFRNEPARIWMDEQQAFALRNGNIDQFLYPVDISKLASGYTESYQMRPGYYEATYEDASTPVNTNTLENAYFQGAFQHYGVYLPANYREGSRYPATFWMHYRGGHAHDAAAWEPNILRSFGDNIGAIVITPSARGESSWYTGRGMVDFLDVWNDAMKRWSIDQSRVYLAGHSMGGWASNLLGILMPDRWAASNPEDGLLVPGLWSGATAPTGPQEGADINAEFLEPLISNTRNVPYAILHGTEDELVPVTGAIAQSLDYLKLGYQYRFYQFHAYEHYSAPIWDDWSGIVNYMKQFTRDANPAHVTFSNRPALDHAVSTISAPQGVDLGLHFDHAYWVSALATRTAGLDPSNIATIDATTSGRGVPQYIPIPDAGSCDQIEPCTMTGQRWLPNGTIAPSNAFTATLTNVGHVSLDLARMGLGTSEPVTATVNTDGASDLLLAGSFPTGATVTGAPSTLSSDGIVLHLPSGTSTIQINP